MSVPTADVDESPPVTSAGSRRWAPVVIGASAAVTTAFLAAGRLQRSFDYDESVAVHTVIGRGSARVALTEAPVFNNHPLFAVGQSIWWAIGGEGEARQRVLPIAYGALAAGLVAAWAARRWGAWPGVAAGVVVVLNPLMIAQTRAVRGYSLAVLGVAVAAIALVEYLDRRDTDPHARRWLVAHGVAATVAVGTHLYSGVPLAAIGVGVVVTGLLDRRLAVTWLASIAVAAAIYAPTFDALRASADERGSRHLSWFGRVTVESLLGGAGATAWLLGGVASIGLAVVAAGAGGDGRANRAVLVAAGVFAALLLLIWQVVAPFDLYPRFFLMTVPLIAVVVARAVAWQPVLVVVVLVAGAFAIDDVVDARSRVVPLREAADVVERVRAGGREPCAVGAQSLAAYTSPPVEIVVDGTGAHLRQFEDCDVVVSIGSWGSAIRADADAVYGRPDRVGPFRVWGATTDEIDG